MTEHTKIPLPGGEEPKESSLFERASGAFGFDPFKPAPIKGKLPEPEMKRAKVRQKVEQPEVQAAPAQPPHVQPPHAPPPPAEQVPLTTSAPIPVAYEAPVPAPIAPSEVVVQQDVGCVELSGPTFDVDREHLREQGLIVPEATAGALREEFRIVKRQLLGTARQKGTALSRRILVSSPHPGEGKTFCASNLAISMACERDGEVLLVDADFAKPSILSTFGLPKGPGLMDCLADESIRPEDLVLGTDIPGLWILPAGNQTNTDSEYLSSERTAEVLDRLTMGAPHRMVIFDSPPALAASPAAELAKHVGQTVLVARADVTGRNALEDAYRLLSGCSDVKLLLNATQFSPSGRNFGSYYGYGE